MKKIMISMAALLMVFCLLVSSFSHSVLANSENSGYSSVVYSYKDMGEWRTSQFVYNDDYFLKDVDEFSGSMAKMCVALSAAAYDQDRINDILDQIGFTVANDNQQYLYDMADNGWDFDDNDHVAYTIAKKQINDQTVILVVVKGTGSNAEWYSNFRLGQKENGFHEGFWEASDNPTDGLYHEVVKTLAQESNVDKVRIVFTGHSRGAAVANLTAGRLIENINGISDNICAYTFACPAVGKNVDTSLSNIYNFNNPGDLITLLPLECEGWGYHRYGKDISIYQSGMLKDDIYYQFSRITGKQCASQDNPVTYIESIRRFVPNPDTYNSAKCQFVFRLIAMFLSGRLFQDFIHVISYHFYEGPRSIGVSWKNLKKAFDKGIIKSIADILVDYAKDTLSFYIELLSFIDSNKETLTHMTEDEWREFYTENYHTIQSIEEYTETEISSANDLINSRDELATLDGLLEKELDSIGDFWTLFFGRDGIVNGALTHGHTPTMYVVTVNARCLGNQGWYSFAEHGSDLSNIQNDDNILCDGNSIQVLQDGTLELGTGCETIDADCLNNCIFSGPVSISESVKLLGQRALGNNPGLTDLTMSCNTDYKADDSSLTGNTFVGCTGLSHITVTGSGIIKGFASESVSRGAPWYISQADELTIELSDDITEIGDFAFCRMNGTSINLPQNLEKIGNYAFESCDRIRISAELPNKLTTIGDYAFSSTPGLGGVLVLPETLTEIGEGAFKNCIGLTGDINLPCGLVEIGDWAFAGCAGLTGELTIPNGITQINDYVFSGCSGITRVIIHEGVERIGKKSFNDCSGITDLIIPCSTKYKNDDMWDSPSNTSISFYGCTGIEHITITGSGEIEGFTSPSYCCGAPWHVSQADELIIDISDDITAIGDYAFYNISSKGTIILPANLERIGEYAFSQTGNELIISADLPQHLQTISDYAFSSCSGLTGDLVLPESLTEIGENAFNHCVGLTGSISFPGELTSIGDSAFADCTGLTGELIIPNGITQVNDYVFSGCSGITKVIIHEGVEKLGKRSFGDCSGITELTIPCSTTYITDDSYYTNKTFVGCTGINLITITGSGKIAGFSSEVLSRGAPWYISQADELTIVLSDDITEIGDYAFCRINSNSSISLPTNLKKIGNHAFEYSSMTTISADLPKKLTDIGDYAFDHCYGLTGDLVLPAGLKTIGIWAFSGCDIQDTYYLSSRESWNQIGVNNNSQFGTVHFFEIVSQPENISAQNAEVKNLSIDAESSTSYQWQRSLDGEVWSNISSSNKNYSGVKTDNMTIKVNKTTSQYLYRCVVKNQWSSLTSDAVIVSLQMQLEITKQPTNVSGKSDEQKTMSVTATNATNYQWQRSSDGETWSNIGSTNTNYSGAKTAELTIKISKNTAGFVYRCVVKNSENTINSETATVSVILPVQIKEEPENISGQNGEQKTMSVTASNATSYQWQRSADDGETWSNIGTTNVNYSGSKTESMTIKVNKTTAGFVYRCVVKNSDSTEYTREATVTVTEPIQELEITAQPEDISGQTGETKTMCVEASNATSYQWQRSADGANWSNISTSNSNYSGAKTASLTVTINKNTVNYVYRCVVKNSNSSVVTNIVSASVAQQFEITEQPESIIAEVGEEKTISVVATNATSYQWQRSVDGKTWSNISTNNVNYSGAKTDTLTIKANSTTIKYVYRCVVKNESGNRVFSQTVEVNLGVSVSFYRATAEPEDRVPTSRSFFLDDENLWTLIYSLEAETLMEGYIFDGWYIDQSCKERIDLEHSELDENAVYYAKWVKSITVTLDGNGGIFFDDADQTSFSFVIAKDYPIEDIPDATNEGFSFEGWFLDPECTEYVDIMDYCPAEDVTFYAKWVPVTN